MKDVSIPFLGRSSLFASFAAAVALVGCGALETQPIAPTGDAAWLDRGEIHGHLGVLRELGLGKKRLDLAGLLDPVKVFDEIKKARTQSHFLGVSRQVQTDTSVTTLIQTGRETTTKESNEENSEHEKSVEVTEGEEPSRKSTKAASGDSKESEESETKDTYARPGGTAAPATRLDATPLTDTLTPSYHHLLYATADTVLGGQALESLYNVEAIPKDMRFFSSPVVVSFEPGRITRFDYTAEARFELLETKCGLKDMSIVAVAPAGFSTFANEASLLAESLRASLSAGIPFGAFLGSEQLAATLEKVEKFSEVARRPEFQVSIESSTAFKIRYLGTARMDGKDAHVSLSPVTFDAELLLIGRFQESNLSADQCKTEVNNQLSTRGIEPPPAPTKSGSKQQPNFRGTMSDKGAVQMTPGARSAAGEQPYSIAEGAVSFLNSWRYVPFHELDGWSEDHYGDNRVGVAPFYRTPEPGITVASVSAAPGPALLVETKGPSSKICLCLDAFDDGSPAAAPLRSTNNPLCFDKASGTSRTLLYPVARAMGKGPIVRVAPIPFRPDGSVPTGVDCSNLGEGWGVFPVKPLASAANEPPPASLTLRAATAVPETDSVAVRLDLEGPIAGKPIVRVNGTEVAVRHFAERKKGTSIVGGVVYVTVAQKVAQRDQHDRILFVDVIATKEGDPKTQLSVSTELRAKW